MTNGYYPTNEPGIPWKEIALLVLGAGLGYAFGSKGKGEGDIVIVTDED